MYLLELSHCPKPHLYIPSTIILRLLCVWGTLRRKKEVEVDENWHRGTETNNNSSLRPDEWWQLALFSDNKTPLRLMQWP